MLKSLLIKGVVAMVGPLMNVSVSKKVDKLMLLVRGEYPELVEIFGMDDIRKACFCWLAVNNHLGVKPPKDKQEVYRDTLNWMQRYLNDYYAGFVTKGMPLQTYVIMETLKSATNKK